MGIATYNDQATTDGVRGFYDAHDILERRYQRMLAISPTIGDVANLVGSEFDPGDWDNTAAGAFYSALSGTRNQMATVIVYSTLLDKPR